MPIKFYYDDVKFRLRRSKKLKHYFSEKVIGENFSPGDISYVFVSDKTLLAINKEFMGHDYFTDIVTFDYNNQNTVNGEIYISIDTVKNNSQIYNVSFKSELLRVMSHGLLHLTGYDDITAHEKIRMRKGEDNWIKGYMDIYGKIDF